MKFLKLLFKYIVRAILAIVLIIAMTLFSFWVEVHSDITLPEPTGQYQVGRTTFHWVDSSRVDSLSPPPFTQRELLVWIWYPASISQGDTLVRYDRAPWEKETGDEGNLLFRLIFARDGSKIRAHSFHNSQVTDKQATFPVLIMKSGIGTLATDYTTFAEELASHGYVVVGSDAPYSTFAIMMPDGRVINRTYQGNPGEAESGSEQRDHILHYLVNIWTDDATFVLNRLGQINSSDTSSILFACLDMNAVGIFGHSFGGATAAQWCSREPRCKAGVNLDGSPYGSVIETGMDKPFMFLLADHAKEDDPVSVKIKSNIRSIYNAITADRYWFYLEGSQHFNFSDIPYQKEWLIMRLSGATGSIGRRHGTEVINAAVLKFFDVYLKGEPKTHLDSLVRAHNEFHATTE